MDTESAKRQLVIMRQRLREQKASFDRDLAESLEDVTGDESYDLEHVGETAAGTLSREIELSLQDNTEALLRQVERALFAEDRGRNLRHL